jgi:hypothetical protein
MDDLKDELKTGLQNDLKAVSSPKDWLSFDKMLAPIIIKILFWIGAVAAVIFGIGAMFTIGFFYGLLILILGPIIVRVWSEILIVVFHINDSLTEIKNNTKS